MHVSGMEMAYLPIIALLNLGVIYGWHKKIRKKWIGHKADWMVLFLGSFFNTWGIETLQVELEIERLYDVFALSLGAWLLFTASSALMHYRINAWSFKNFWLDYGGDLLSYFFIGILIYLSI